MQNKEHEIVSTIERLTEIAITQATYHSATRYDLRKWSSKVADDQAAMDAWDEKLDALKEGYHAKSNIYYAFVDGYKEAYEELLKSRPSEHIEHHCYLNAERYGTDIYLSLDLYNKLDAAWLTTKYGRAERAGRLTLKGILQRLGADSNLSEQIDAAKIKIEQQRKLNARNSARRTMRQSIADYKQTLISAVEKSDFVPLPSTLHPTISVMGAIELLESIIGNDETQS